MNSLSSEPAATGALPAINSTSPSSSSGWIELRRSLTETPSVPAAHVWSHIGTARGAVKWSPDGQLVASATGNRVHIWHPETGLIVKSLEGHQDAVRSLSWSPNGRYLASGSYDRTIRLWDIATSQVRVLEGHRDLVSSVDWTPNGEYLASGSFDLTVKLWNVKTREATHTFYGHADNVVQVALSPDGQKLASCGDDETVRLWDLSTMSPVSSRMGHSGFVVSLTWSHDGKVLASGSYDRTICIWDQQRDLPLVTCEGHTDTVRSLCFSPDDRVLASTSHDNTTRFWRRDTWTEVACIPEVGHSRLHGPLSCDFHPATNLLAVLHLDSITRLWEIGVDGLLQQATGRLDRYVTAKVVLVGDAGVGKTGLGWVLAGNDYREHSSTHGQQFWTLPSLAQTRNDGTECEAILWDLAGQPDYRLVHSLYLDDVDAALVLFDPTIRQDPLAAVDFWLSQLAIGRSRCFTILVGARIDRGSCTLTELALQEYCQQRGIQGGYIQTSAKVGTGLEELIQLLRRHVPWDEMTATVTTSVFKGIKELMLRLKETAQLRRRALIRPAELRDLLESEDLVQTSTLESPTSLDEVMMTAVQHLEHHGFVTTLHGSNGDSAILLTPDLLINLASSIVIQARKHPRGLGCVTELTLLRGDYMFPECEQLTIDDARICLDAVVALFLERNLCFRESFNEEVLLVFPSLISEKRPNEDSIDFEEGNAYRLVGASETVFPSLVVQLGYTNTFVRTNQWRHQAQYETNEGSVCGFRQQESGECSELVLYFGVDVPPYVRSMFAGMFELFLSRHECGITRIPPVRCSRCNAQLSRNVIAKLLGKERRLCFCYECGQRVPLPSPEPVGREMVAYSDYLGAQRKIAKSRTRFESTLVRIKALLRDRHAEGRPSCFVSYAWGTPEHAQWVLQLAKDLRNADVDVLLDQWSVSPGDNLDRYIERVMSTDYVVVVGTQGLRAKYDSTSSDPVVTAELEMLNVRLRQTNFFKHNIIPVLVEGDPESAFTPQLQKLVHVDCTRRDDYFTGIFDVIWRLHSLPLDHQVRDELRASIMSY